MITFDKRNNVLIVALKGEIDHHSTEDIRNTIDREYERCGSVNLIFDFSDVEFMDSAGIGLILGRYKAVNEANGRVAIVGSSAAIDRILDISGIYKIIKCYNSMEDAFNGIK